MRVIGIFASGAFVMTSCAAAAQTAPEACGDACHAAILARTAAGSTQVSVNALAADVSALRQQTSQIATQLAQLQSGVRGYFTITGNNLGQCNAGPQQIDLVTLKGCMEPVRDVFCGKFSTATSHYETVAIARDGLTVKAITCARTD